MNKWLVLVMISIGIYLLDGWGGFNWLKRPVSGLVIRLTSKQLTAEQLNQAETAVDTAELLSLKQENQRLRELMAAPLAPNWQFLPAKVISRSRRSLKIDVGEKQGVKVGEAVMGYIKDRINNGVVIGQVSQVSVFQSEVRLLSNKQSQVRVKTESGVRGVVVGDDSRLVLAEVLQGQQLVKGELIMTEGGDGWLAGLVVGRVGELESEATAVFQQAGIEPVIYAEELLEVWVASWD